MQSLFCIVVLFLYGVVGISLRAPSSVVAGDAIQISWRRGRRDDRVFGLRFRSADFEGEMSRVDSRGDDDGIERIVVPNRAGNYVVEAITGDRFPTFSNIIRVQARPEVPPTPPAPVPLPPPTVPSNGSAPGGVRPEPTPGPGNEQPEEDTTLSTTRSDTIQSTSSPPRPTPTSASSDSDKARVSATSSQPTSLETANAAVLPTNRSDPAPPSESVAPDATISGNTSKSSKSNAGMIAGIVVAVLLVLGILFFVLIRARRRQRKRHTNVFFNDKMVSNVSHRTGLTSISAPPGSNRSLAGTTGHYYDSTASTPQPFLQEKRDVYLQPPHPYSQRPQSVNVEDAYSGYVDTEPAPPTAIYYSSQYPPSPSSPAIHAKSSSGQRLSEFKFPGPRS